MHNSFQEIKINTQLIMDKWSDNRTVQIPGKRVNPKKGLALQIDPR